MIAFSSFVSRVKDIVFPDLEPENLGIPHRNYIINALIIAQTHIQCLRTSNVNFYTKENAIDSCDVSAITVPSHAIIQAVYAFKPCLGCTRHFYRGTATNEIVCYANSHAKCACTTEADICNEANYGDQFCQLYYGGATEEPDTAFLCADKMFAKGANDQLYLAPRFPCGYQIGFHWSGVKRNYEDYDAIVDDQDVIDLVSLYLEGERAQRIDRDFPKYEKIMGNGRDARDGGSFWFRLADINFRCREEVKVSKTITCHSLSDESAFEHFLPTPLPERPPCVECQPLTLSIGPNPGSGVLVPFSVTLSTNRTATIYYTLDGSAPTKSSTRYTAAFTLTSFNTTVRAIAYDSEDCASNAVTATWISGCGVSAPSFSPTPTSSPMPASSVTITVPSGTTVYYTKDGTTPTINSPVYPVPTPAGGLSVDSLVSQTFKAVAYANGCYSSVISQDFRKICTGSGLSLGNTTIVPSSPHVFLTLTLDSAYTAYYTTDGSTPDNTDTLYNPAVGIELYPGLTLRVVAYQGNCRAEEVSRTYISACNSPAVAFSFNQSNNTVSISTSDGSIIRYTMGVAPADPTAASTLYSVPLTIPTGETLKARAFNAGDATCFGAVSTYVHTCDLPAVTVNPPNGSSVQFPTYARPTAPTGTTIYYTTNGDTPTAASTLYGASGDGGASGTPILVSSPLTTLKFVAVRSGSCSGPVTPVQYETGSAFEFKYMCDTPDYSGVFFEFGPNGETDYHWMLGFALPSAREITAIEIYETAASGIWNTGQAWATRSPINPVEGPANFSVYPLVIFENQVQKFAAYQTTLGTFSSGAHVLEMYGDIRTPLTGFFKIIVFYGDGTRTEQVIPHTCVAVSPGFGTTATCPEGLGNTYTISGYADGFFQGECGGGVNTQELFDGVLEGSPCNWSGAGLMYSSYVGLSNAGHNVSLIVTSRGWTLSFFGRAGNGDPLVQGVWYKSGGLTPVGTYYLLDKYCDGIGPATLALV